MWFARLSVCLLWLTTCVLGWSAALITRCQQLLFDEDESGTIEEKEFLEGFKKWVLSEPVSIPAGNPTLLEVPPRIR